jgi:hypothetical protein
VGQVSNLPVSQSKPPLETDPKESGQVENLPHESVCPEDGQTCQPLSDLTQNNRWDWSIALRRPFGPVEAERRH